MKLRAFTLLAGFSAIVTGTAFAQGVAINGTGAPADTSAILDLNTTSKGFLPPRMTAAQRTAIVQPATGLLVYQTDGAQGLYYNLGTPFAPNWRLVNDAANTGPWALNGSSAYYSGGNVGIGTSTPTHPLNIIGGSNGLRVQTNASGGAAISVGGFGTVGVDAPGVANGRLALLENGNLGLGVANPTNKLSFAAVAGKKISLYPAGANDYGFGISGGRLQIFNDGTPGGDVAIGTDAAGTFTERFAVKSNGALAVGGSTGAAGQVLRSNGSGAAATWGSPTQASYDNTILIESSTITSIPQNASAPLVGFSRTINLTGNAKVLIDYWIAIENAPCALCGDLSAYVRIYIDGAPVRSDWVIIPNAKFSHLSQHYFRELGAGVHVIELYGDTFGRPGEYCAGPDPSLMSIQVIPQ